MPTGLNDLIDQLPRRDRLSLLSQGERVPLVLGEVLCEHGQPTSSVYFPTHGFISLVAISQGNPGLEVGMVGREGMLGVQLALGVATAPLHAIVQGEGTAWRFSAGEFKAEWTRSTALQLELGRYVYVLMSQLAAAATCLRYHQIGPRLARWLLMSQDRAHSASFPVTQEFLAYMLGVRRVGITTAAGALRQQGLIDYHRGTLHVLDRAGLESAACSCYAADRKSYAGSMKKAATTSEVALRTP